MTDPVVPAPKNPQTTFQAIGGFVLILIVITVGLYFQLPASTVAIMATIVGGVCTTFLGFSAADAATTNAFAGEMASQLAAGLATAKAEYTALHAKNATAIAVHSAELAMVKPLVNNQPAVQVSTPEAQITTPEVKVSAADVKVTGGHLVE